MNARNWSFALQLIYMGDGRMCLSVPAEVLEIQGNRAIVSVGGARYVAGLHLVEDVQVGDYLLIHSGYGIQKISPEEAEKTLEFLRETFEARSKE